MTEKELKRLNRRQLLELLIIQTERADRLQEQLDDANRKLEQKTIVLSEAGSIAEASLKLSGVFDAAQTAAEDYLENVRQLTAKGEEIEAEAAEKAKQLLEEAEAQCRLREQAADAYWEETKKRIRQQSELLYEIFLKERNAE